MSGFVQRQRTGPPVDQQALQHSAAMHGQVVDLFPGGALGPVRIDMETGRIAAQYL